jgi:hypothetical protein
MLHLAQEVHEARGECPWGAGIIGGIGGKDPSPTEKEIETANFQGEVFYNVLAKVEFEE